MIFLLAFEICLKNFQCCLSVAHYQVPLSFPLSKWLNVQEMKHLVHELVLSKLIPMVQYVFVKHHIMTYNYFLSFDIE